MLLAGNETTTNLISNGLLAFAREEGEFRRLRTTPGIVGSAVEEILRYDSPVQMLLRYCRRETVVGGTCIPSGAIAIVLLGAANRDPSQFPEPSRFDIGRKPNDHLAFGDGIHACVGARLARLQGTILFEAISRRFRTIRLAEPDRPVEYQGSLLSRGLSSLRIVIS
jgi:cytochrome P450